MNRLTSLYNGLDQPAGPGATEALQVNIARMKSLDNIVHVCVNFVEQPGSCRLGVQAENAFTIQTDVNLRPLEERKKNNLLAIPLRSSGIPSGCMPCQRTCPVSCERIRWRRLGFVRCTSYSASSM